MENMELDAVVLLDKLSKRIAEDAKTIAMLEASLDVYVAQVKELQKQLALTKEINQ